MKNILLQCTLQFVRFMFHLEQIYGLWGVGVVFV
jgi:hypothetical protein